MRFNQLKEEIAERIYWYEGGCYPEEYEEIMGRKKLHFKDHGHLKIKEEDILVEHERDEYRLQAEKVILYLLEKGLVELKRICPDKEEES